MQSAKLCKVENHSKREIVQSATLCKVQHHEKYKNVQSAKSYNMQNDATCKHSHYTEIGLKPNQNA